METRRTDQAVSKAEDGAGLLRLTRVEANVDSKTLKGQGSLKGFFKGRRLGASIASPSNDRLRRTFQGDRKSVV